MKKLIANLKYLMTANLQQDFDDIWLDQCDNANDDNLLRQAIHAEARRSAEFREWAVQEIGSIAESIAETRLPLHSSKVCIPCPDILEQGDWVTPAYFCNTCGIANGVEVAQQAYNIWKATHFDKEPTRSRHNEAYPVYPVGFLRDLINGRYDDITNK